MRLQEQKTQPHYDTYKRKKEKETKAVNGTSSRHLALADGSIPPDQVWWRGPRETAGSRGGGATCVAALARLPLHHHLPGDAGDLTIRHHTRDPRLVLCLLSQWGHPWLLPEEEAGPPVARVLLRQSWMVRDDLAAVLRTATRAAAGRRADAPSVVVSGRHERPPCWDSCHCWSVGRCTLC